MIRKQGFVALLDVLGFRDLISRADVSNELDRYVQSIASVVDRPAEGGRLHYVLFSDSVVLYSEDDSAAAFSSMVVACSQIVRALLHEQVAVRGAIAFGSFIRSTGAGAGVIVAGRPIVEAFEYEHAQDWLGVMLCPSVVRHNPDVGQQCAPPPRVQGEAADAWLSRMRLSLHLQAWGGIPFHANDPHAPRALEGFAIVPMADTVTTAAEAVADLDDTIRRVAQLKLLAPDPTAQRKYTETLAFYQSARHEWRARA